MVVLILGGYGTFGSRLAMLLSNEPGVQLLIAGRSPAKAASLCARLPGNAAAAPLVFDRDADLPAQLRAADPDLVIDASGPFQDLGPHPYRVVEACLDLGIDYIDLADGTTFVSGIEAFDALARDKAVFVLSGASTCPALTGAVVRSLSAGLRVEAVCGGIAPSPRVALGLNVVRAIASYAGRPLKIRQDGQPADRFALIDTRRFTIRPPGARPLGPITFSLVDVPDLEVMPKMWPHLRSIWFGAGPRPAILHRLLRGAAWLVRLRILRSLTPLAGFFHRSAPRFRWGDHRGGMFVEVRGRDVDAAIHTRSWHLVAEGDDGPFIPVMAAVALVRRLLGGQRPPAGARSAARDLELADFEPLFASKRMSWGGNSRTAGYSLYRRALGPVFDRLPSTLQVLHDGNGSRAFAGRAQVDRGGSPLARLVAALFRFPKAGTDVPVTVDIDQRGEVEIWRRNFAGRSFRSLQVEGRRSWEGLIVERFGPVAVGLQPTFDAPRLSLVVRRWSAFGVPLPLALAPGGTIFETEQDGRFTFHVEIAHPFMGLIVRYRGWLKPEP